MNTCRENLQPALIPFWELIKWDEDHTIGVITIPADAPDKPYRAKRGGAWLTYIRVGSVSREATREEEARLFQASGLVRYDLRPVPGSTIADLDSELYQSYFRDVLRRKTPAPDDDASWTKILLNTDILIENQGRAIPTIAGMLLFGVNPHRYLPQAGITATAFQGTKKDNEMIKDILRDYEYVESRGMGVPEKIIAGMRAHNRTEPDLIEEESRFIVRLWKKQEP
jgi:ATP-dependent DNA helicase RecG